MRGLFWPVFVVTGAVYFTMILWSLPHLSATAGGLKMFDMRPGGYGLDQARAVVAALGPAGTGFYLTVQQRLDTVFPGLLALTLILAFLRLFPRRIALALSLVALAVAGFDWLENAGVATMLRAGPDGLTAAMVGAASRWSVLKSAVSTLAYSALLAGLVLAGWRWWRQRSGG